MEKYGEPGRIHVSAATCALLGDRYNFEPRGMIEIKGKGEMETYFLERRIGSRFATARADGLVIHAPATCEAPAAMLDPAMAAIDG
jgi:class 3 adenylate cyclase